MNAEEQHIIDELKKQPGEVPGEDYFARLKAEVMEKASTLSVLDPPPLPSDDAANGYPQSSSVIRRTLPSEGGSKIIPLYRKTWFQIAAAASVVLIVTLFALNGGEAPKTRIAQTQQPDWNSVSQEEVLAYIDENIDDFETEVIAQHLDPIPQWNTETELAVNGAPVTPKAGKEKTDKYDELFNELDQEDILEYLEDEGELDEDLLF